MCMCMCLCVCVLVLVNLKVEQIFAIKLLASALLSLFLSFCFVLFWRREYQNLVLTGKLMSFNIAVPSVELHPHFFFFFHLFFGTRIIPTLYTNLDTMRFSILLYFALPYTILKNISMSCMAQLNGILLFCKENIKTIFFSFWFFTFFFFFFVFILQKSYLLLVKTLLIACKYNIRMCLIVFAKNKK